jgi:precorrin-6Y C5,15-methyltransferase (decarboxylating)
MLGRNRAGSGVVGRLHVVAGEAPEALGSLPDPDAVFIGGSGGRLAAILDAATARLRAGGRVVANLVTYEHVAALLAWAREHDVEAELVQVSVSRGASILEMTRLQAENPVTVVTLAP